MTLQERADAHRDRLTELTADDGPLTAAGATATVRNPEWFAMTRTGVQPLAARRDLHRRILDAADAAHPDVATDRAAIVLAGPPGAGKSTALRALLAETGSRPDAWRVINSDDFKDDLLDAALADGSYHRWLVPAAVAELEAAGEDFAPRELASLVHEESGMLAQQAMRRAVQRGDNLVVDGTLSNEAGAHRLLDQLSAAGYEVRIAVVEAPHHVVDARIAARWREGYLAAQNGTLTSERDARLGGRWVAGAFARGLYPPGRPAESVCTSVAAAVAERHPAVVQLDLYRVTSAAASPQLHAHRIRTTPTGPLLDPDTTRAAEAAALARISHHTQPRTTTRPAPEAARTPRRPGTDRGHPGPGLGG